MRARLKTRGDLRQDAENDRRNGPADMRNHAPTTDVPSAPAIHPAVGRAFEALERASIQWCLLRGEAELTSTDGDVDLLAARGDMPRLREALAGAGYVPLRAWGRGSHRFFVGWDEESSRRIKLDVVTQLAYGRYQEVRIAGADGCLARRRYLGTLALLSPDDAFWTLLLHCMLDREAFSVAQQERLLELAGEADCTSDLGNLVDGAFAGRGESAALLELVHAEDWTALTTIAQGAPAVFGPRRRLEMRLRRLGNRSLRWTSKVLPRGRW